jgi:hypothetical protein
MAGHDRRAAHRGRKGAVMLKFDPTTVYTKSDLRRELAGTMSVTTFLFRVKPPSISKGVFLGRDLIRALYRVNQTDTRTDAAADRLDGMTSTNGGTIAPMPRRLDDDQGDSLTRTRSGSGDNKRIRKDSTQTILEGVFKNNV